MWARVLFVVMAVFALGVGYSGPARLPLYGPRPTLEMTRLAPPAGLKSGRLTWLGGARLESDDGAFGGFSALGLAGRQFTLLNDGGNYVSFALGPDWRAGEVRFGALPDGPGTGWDKRDRDSETLVAAPGGQLWVSFERANAIWRYAPGFARADRSARPSGMGGWSSNGGAEAMARLRDGRFVVLAESSQRDQPGHAGIVFASDPVTAPDRGFRFTYLTAAGFKPTDAAMLPNGDLLVLERCWRLPLRFWSRLVRVKAAALRPGARVRGVELGRIAPSWPAGNYEAVAVAREGKATILWLASDNDQASWRANYLLKLRLD